MRILFLFVDGIGLGDDDAEVNPFVTAQMPTLTRLSNGHRWLRTTGRQANEEAVFIPTDASMGVEGRPQSGSSQAVILTGRNVPRLIGRHYGPKPDAQTRAILNEDNIFMRLKGMGRKAALIDGYPPSLLRSIERGKKLPSSIQQGALSSGQALFTLDDVIAGRALTAEWTGDEWHSHLKLTDAPLYTPFEAGVQMAKIAQSYDFAFHSHWLTDYVGHKGFYAMGVSLLERLDGVVRGILSVWDTKDDMILLTSDHGNMEVIGHRQHTENLVPTLMIGSRWRELADGFEDLSHFYGRIVRSLGV